MSNQMELAVEERTAYGKRGLRLLREQGIVPANVYGQHQPSLSLQVNGLALQRLLGHGGGKLVLSLKVGSDPAIQALIKQVHHDPRGGAITHVDFLRLEATEKLRTHVQFSYVGESEAVKRGGAIVSRPLNEVMVECLPADLPSTIQVDLARLSAAGDVIRVRDLSVASGVTILTDPNEMVAGVYQKAAEKEAEGMVETVTPLKVTTEGAAGQS